MTGTARIRWEETSLGEFAGRVGTIRWLAYQMRPPAYDGGAWQLTSYIPGSIGKCTHYDDREEAQAKAEEWLTEFTASIGAVFPEALLKLADEWKQHAAPGDAQDECADELRETIAASLPGSTEDIVAASIEQQSGWRNELRHPGMNEKG